MLASKSPLVVTLSRFCHHDLRGLTRNLSADFPVSRSHVHLTSAAVNGLPSCHLTPSRSLNVSVVPASSQLQLVAKSGLIVSKLFCAICWSNRTRLLKIAIIGPSATIVDSSWIDMLAGLSPC